MNLRRWTKEHTIGVLLGLVTPILFVPIAMFIYGFFEDVTVSKLWEKFQYLRDEKSKFISLACLGNLLWFHLSIRVKKFNLAMGIILSTFVYLFFVLYLKFIA